MSSNILNNEYNNKYQNDKDEYEISRDNILKSTIEHNPFIINYYNTDSYYKFNLLNASTFIENNKKENDFLEITNYLGDIQSRTGVYNTQMSAIALTDNTTAAENRKLLRTLYFSDDDYFKKRTPSKLICENTQLYGNGCYIYNTYQMKYLSNFQIFLSYFFSFCFYTGFSLGLYGISYKLYKKASKFIK